MLPSEIYKNCLAIEQLMTSRGFHRPEVAFFVNFFAGRPYCLKVEMRTTEEYSSSINEYLDVETDDQIFALFEQARAWVAAQKNPETIRKEQFIAALGRVIDEGNALGLDIDFMNPLVESMKALSTNILEYRS